MFNVLVRLSLVAVIDANWVLQWEIVVSLSLALISPVVSLLSTESLVVGLSLD